MKAVRWGLGALGVAVAGAVVIGALGLGVGASAQEPPAPNQNGTMRERIKERLEEHRPGLMKGVRNVFGAAAEIIGIDPATLKTELQAGKSLTQIASDRGVNREELKTGIIKSVTTQLTQAVADGKITEAQKTEILSRFNEHIDKLVDGTRADVQERVRSHMGQRPGAPAKP